MNLEISLKETTRSGHENFHPVEGKRSSVSDGMEAFGLPWILLPGPRTTQRSMGCSALPPPPTPPRPTQQKHMVSDVLFCG